MGGAAIMVTPAQIRAFAGLPVEVPEVLLAGHIQIAARDLARRTGLNAVPAGRDDDWREAMTVRALASVLPWLNTFALSGAAKVGRLEGSVEYRFLDPDEVAARVAGLMARFDALVATLSPNQNDHGAGQVSLPGITMIAI